MKNQFGAWTPIGAEQSGQNFVVVWRNTVLNQYVTWTVDGNGNFLSQSALLSPTSFALESLETPFGQNLNGDGTTGLTTAPIEAIGSTTLTQVADSYFVNYGGPSAVQLRYGGMYVAANQFGAWVPIGAEQAGNTYQVVWRNGAADQYLAWTVDLNGNFLSQGGIVSGASWYAESFEILRHAPGFQR